MMTQLRSLLLALLLGVMLLSGCASAPAVPTPPEIHYGEDLCSDCGMIINDPRFASAYVHETGNGRFESLIFDDIGDMLHHMQANQTLKAAGWWVHDYQSEEWLDATMAYYVVSEQIKSPMNHGIAAFATQDEAATIAAGFAVPVLDWDGLRIEHALAAHAH